MGKSTKDGVRIDKTEDKEIAPPVSSLSVEDRLRMIAYVIVDRLVDDQVNGNLRPKNHGSE